METFLRRQTCPSLAARETYVAETNFAFRKQKMFLPEVKNIFASRTQMLLSKNMFPTSHLNNVDQGPVLLIENVPTMADVEVEVEEKGKKETNWKDVERELLIALHV